MRNAAFVMFHTDNLILMNARWNGTWGFPGGMVEEGESLLQAAVRECEEEIGAKVGLADVEYKCNHLVREGLTSHAFSCKVSYDKLMEITKTAMIGEATHAEELNGVGLFDIDRHNFYKMPLAPTVIEELEEVFGERLKGVAE